MTLMVATFHIDAENRCVMVGELNFQTVAVLWQETQSFRDRYAVWYVDFSQIKSSNSSGLALLLAWIKQAKAQHKTLHFAGLPAALLSTAAVCGLDGLLRSFSR